ncbi:MAG: YfhO family protein [Clostridia bacterium]|nr:YfhO family protein [Clostridia bacterium]
MNKIKNHFSTKKNYYIVAGAITALFLIIYACCGAFPFGTKTIAHYDMYHQIITFMNLIFDGLEGEVGSLVFSNKLAGGANIVGFLCYLIFSPFYIVLLMFGRDYVIYGINLVFILQIIAIAISFMWFVRKYFNLSSVWQICISIAYSLSAYVLFNYTWFSWLFLVMLMPVLIHNFLQLVKYGKMTGFTITVVLMIFNCYGVGMCGQILLYILFSIFVFLMVDKDKRKIVMSKLLLCYVIALGVSLFMLGPNALQLSESSRVSSIAEGFLENDMFRNIPYGIAYLLIDVVLLSLNIVFVLMFNKKSKFSSFLLASLVLCTIPIILDGITLVLTLGSYYGYNMRMSYVLTFIMFLSAIVVIKNITKENFVAKDVKPEKYTKKFLIILLSVGYVFYFVCGIVFFIPLSTILANATVVPLSVLLILAMVVAIIITIILTVINTKNGRVTKKFLYSILLIVFGVQCVMNPVLFTNQGFKSTTRIVYLDELSVDKNNARLKDFNGELGDNEHLLTGFSSFSCFASQVHKNAVAIGKAFGYKNGTNVIDSFGGTVLSDAFFGYEYFVAEYEQNRPYLTLVDKKIIDKDNTTYIYKNSLYLPNAVVVSKDKELDITEDIFSSTQSLYEYLGGTGEIISKVSLYDLIKDNSVELVNYKLDGALLKLDESMNTSVNGGQIKLTINPSDYNKVVYTVFYKELFESGKDILVGLGQSDYLKEFRENMFSDVGYVSKGNFLVYDINFIEDLEADKIFVAQLDYDKVENLILNLQNQTVDFALTSNGFELKVNGSQDQKVIVTNTNINGTQVSRNGRNYELTDLELIEVELVDGENHISSTFKFPYVRTIILAGMVGVIILVAGIVTNKYLLKKKKILNPLYYGAVACSILFTAVVYLMPSLICVVRVCLFKF